MAWSILPVLGAGAKPAASYFAAIKANFEALTPVGTVFTNEAARDAAITAPTEGMQAYLSAPTVPAAAGDATAVPTGVTTRFNGSVWVCVTQVGAATAATGTTTSTSNTVTLSGSPGTNPSVTLVTGATALVSLSAWMSPSDTSQDYMSVNDGQLEIVGQQAGGYNNQKGLTGIVTGLTPGTNTFTLWYRVGAGTLSVAQRRITAQGIA